MSFQEAEDFEAEEKVIYNVEDIDFELPNAARTTAWIEAVVARENRSLEAVSYIFCSDDYLHDMNVTYLNHDTLTDVITFPYNRNPVEGDIFISIDRVRDNAKDLGLPFETELNRVMIHGILHICGYLDETDAEEAEMRAKEDACLALLATLESEA